MNRQRVESLRRRASAQDPPQNPPLDINQFIPQFSRRVTTVEKKVSVRIVGNYYHGDEQLENRIAEIHLISIS